MIANIAVWLVVCEGLKFASDMSPILSDTYFVFPSLSVPLLSTARATIFPVVYDGIFSPPIYGDIISWSVLFVYKENEFVV